ncbi:MAG TPA: transporter substrate-binding domain-containing protein [Candidatus Limnocylindria bacterium]|nr:transporter substrate-binding domain-containing protein [Candidatus Limnocylindria bacterium]
MTATRPRAVGPRLAALVVAALVSAACPAPVVTPSPSPTASPGPTRPRLELSTYQYALQVKNKIRVAVMDTTPPYSARGSSGRYEGFEPDLAREIARAIWGANDDPDSHIEWISVDASTRVSALTGNQVDVTIAAIVASDETRKVIDLTDGYYRDGQRLLVKRTNEQIKELVDVASGDQTVAAVKASPWEQNLRRVTNDRAKVLPLDTLAFCLDALNRGAADAFTQDEATLVGLVAKDPSVKIVAKQFTDDQLAIGIKKNVSADRQGFREFVNTVLLRIVADRTWAKLYERYVTPITGEKKQLPTD